MVDNKIINPLIWLTIVPALIPEAGKQAPA